MAAVTPRLIRGVPVRKVTAELADVAFAAAFGMRGTIHRRPLLHTNARIVIVGGGTAGITVAARLCRSLANPQVVVVEPSDRHLYQPGQTLVGGGVFPKEHFIRAEQDYIPRGATWIQDTVMEIDPDSRKLITRQGTKISYDFLVIATGVQLRADQIPGLGDSLGRNGICSIYTPEQAERTWQMIASFQGGTALFTMPPTPIKCGGAPQKIMYLATDYFTRAGVRSKTQVIFAAPGERIFGIEAYARTLERVVEEKGIVCSFRHQLVAVRPEKKEAVFAVQAEKNAGTGSQVTIPYDLLHVVPPMSPPAAVQESSLAHVDGPHRGWLKIDRYTLQHPDYDNVFGLGDVLDVPSTKTGAAVRKQAPIVVHNLLATIQGRDTAHFVHYHGYTSCPLITGYGRVLLAEFDYDFQPICSFPLDPTTPRYSMWLLKVYGLPALYWHGMLRGLA